MIPYVGWNKLAFYHGSSLAHSPNPFPRPLCNSHIPIDQERFFFFFTYHPYIKRALVIGKGAWLCSNLIPIPCSSWRFSKHSLISPVSHWVSVLCGKALYACELLAFYPVSVMALILFPFGRTREWREDYLLMQHINKRCSCLSEKK